MKASDYQKDALILCPLKFREDVNFALLGLGEETGELFQLIRKARRDGRELNLDRVKEECGDILWNVSVLCSILNINLDDVMSSNIKKIFSRIVEAK